MISACPLVAIEETHETEVNRRMMGECHVRAVLDRECYTLGGSNQTRSWAIRRKTQTMSCLQRALENNVHRLFGVKTNAWRSGCWNTMRWRG